MGLESLYFPAILARQKSWTSCNGLCEKGTALCSALFLCFICVQCPLEIQLKSTETTLALCIEKKQNYRDGLKGLKVWMRCYQFLFQKTLSVTFRRLNVVTLLFILDQCFQSQMADKCTALTEAQSSCMALLWRFNIMRIYIRYCLPLANDIFILSIQTTAIIMCILSLSLQSKCTNL